MDLACSGPRRYTWLLRLPPLEISMRSVFFGTPPIAVPALQALTEVSEVVSVVCQPDRPAGRGMKLQEPAVKQAARALGIDVHQPRKVKTGTLHEWLAERHVDVAVVLAYGRILPESVLAAPRRGCLNLHASLLPRYRGAAPINWAIMEGETTTGWSLMQMEVGLDTGPVFSTRSLEIGPDETAGELALRLGRLAGAVVREDLPRVVAGELQPAAQDDDQASWAPLLEKGHLGVDWTRGAQEIKNQVRGLSPRPGARTTLNGKGLKLHEVGVVERGPAGQPGEVVIADKSGLLIAAGDGHAVEIFRAQLEGRRALPAADLVNGHAFEVGQRLGQP